MLSIANATAIEVAKGTLCWKVLHFIW